MTNFPRMMSFVVELHRERKMYDFEDVNQILVELSDAGIVEPTIEPIDENECHPLDWASVVGVDIFDEVYPEADFFLDK
jgi:hypothetical protein